MRRINATCGALSLRFGPEVLVFFMPGKKVNPWAGYGIGRESIALGSSTDRVDSAVAFAGWEFAHLMGGVDFRLNRVFGIGPFVDFALGRRLRIFHRAYYRPTMAIDDPAPTLHELGLLAKWGPKM